MRYFIESIYKREFRQEGWNYHLENTGDPLTYNGVVYNRNEGCIFLHRMMFWERDIMNSLFLILRMAVNQAEPENIPDLSYEEFLDFHRTYYHPSNSFIYLYGNMDMTEKLDFIDKNIFLH